MFQYIYVEDAIREHPQTQETLLKYPRATVVPCQRYGEIFNRKGQNFRLQKNQPLSFLLKNMEKLFFPLPQTTALEEKIITTFPIC